MASEPVPQSSVTGSRDHQTLEFPATARASPLLLCRGSGTLMLIPQLEGKGWGGVRGLGTCRDRVTGLFYL